MPQSTETLKRGLVGAVVPTALLFVAVCVLALLTVSPYKASGATVFANPSDPADIIFLFGALLVFTAVFLLIARFWKKQVLRVIILGAVGLTVFTTLSTLLQSVLPVDLSLFASVAVAAVLVAALVKYPEWYVIDACCVIVGATVVGVLGISLSIPLVIALLVGLAIYDAISVYGTKHMIDLADSTLSLRLPIILVIPRTMSYSLLKENRSLKAKPPAESEREAFFVGLGDIVMPGLLVVSTFSNIANGGLIVAAGVMLGTISGLVVLMMVVLRGRPQAGLPLLCGGAILGYMLSSYLLFGTLAGVL